LSLCSSTSKSPMKNRFINHQHVPLELSIFRQFSEFFCTLQPIVSQLSLLIANRILGKRRTKLAADIIREHFDAGTAIPTAIPENVMTT
jgi:hypothetical protein